MKYFKINDVEGIMEGVSLVQLEDGTRKFFVDTDLEGHEEIKANDNIQNNDRKEQNNMVKKYRRNSTGIVSERTEQGLGVPDMPTMQWKDGKPDYSQFDTNSDQNVDDVELVKRHFYNQLGCWDKVNERLRTTSSLKLLELIQEIKSNKHLGTRVVARSKDGRIEAYAPPTMRWELDRFGRVKTDYLD